MSAEAALQTQTRVIKVSREQLPLSCPLPEEDVWNLHPRVYLPMAKTGEAVCPYCSTHYLLTD
ncbi:zinc-finger domain-containing protein [Thiolapillus sp.]